MRTLLVAGAWVMLVVPTAAAGTVTLASGEIIEGTIQGRVLIARTTKDGDSAVRVLEGKDVTKFDETGVHCNAESILLVGMTGATIEDVLQGLIWWDEGRVLKTGQALVRNVGKAQIIGVRTQPDKVEPFPGERVLGGYVIDQRRKRIEVVDSVRVLLPDGGLRAIPVAEIKSFYR